MDACNLLIDRPWQYDVDARHEGRKNIYTITKNGENFTMTPLPDDSKDKHIVTSVMLVDEKELMKVLKEEDTPFFAIVFKPKDEPKKQPKSQEARRKVGPKKVQDLLDKYKEIVANNTTYTLPPQREISHCVDLIPGATLPNKAACKLTPEQNAEATRQIQELLEKGFIRKSISTCAVPTVLAPTKEGTWRLCTDSRGLSPIFNVADIYAYKNAVHDAGDASLVDPPTPDMMADVLSQRTPEIEYIADKRIRKQTRRQTYCEFLVKWKGKLLEDATWMIEEAIKLT
ncbi:uncharacterized protein LOC131079703 [Cryptomeria japonica]|uniref:uncharacterized protein LOC131079703 n=1 Tax=Cryptomeria japonica TaxID=3369 RepID=UPI0027D9E1FE|nr:uncharacterized protein LOC131079703 [Cryptomeria japonica]